MGARANSGWSMRKSRTSAVQCKLYTSAKKSDNRQLPKTLQSSENRVPSRGRTHRFMRRASSAALRARTGGSRIVPATLTKVGNRLDVAVGASVAQACQLQRYLRPENLPTTEPAPMTTSSPIQAPAQMVTLAPHQTREPTHRLKARFKSYRIVATAI